MNKPKLTPEAARRDHREMLMYLAMNAAAGALMGALVAIAIIWFDAGGIGTRIARSSHQIIGTLLLVVPFAAVFGGVVAASAIITMPYEKKFRD
ncbi:MULTISPECIES: hypothetical protein [unclassified Aminobacter]|uniref:hypothetical protein n=1 Tax=unclassified Aminobacter TaxID=2644704 RepID=UPI0004644613|nr:MULTISPECIES: hypothetical protein [unclassified Aminobacter]TWG53731.1 hypothetical protein L610_004600000030 [Aminobacter sp. J44]TWH28223.1 hypothetical protein L611_004400000180 [Aminobacter sp. J15]